MTTPMEVSPAAEVWVATALLHREHPDQEAFKLQKIVDKAYSLGFAAKPRPGTVLHATQHLVATKPPSPIDHRMLTVVDGSQRRLYRDGDPFHEGRRNGATHPEPEEIPEEHRGLLDWYRNEYLAEKTA